MKYHFTHHFLVCNGPRCNNPDRGEVRGEPIQEKLKDLNKQLGRKATVRVCKVSCLDLCDYGPNMIAYPSGTVYSHLDHEKALRAYQGEMGDGPKAEDLELKELELVKKPVE